MSNDNTIPEMYNSAFMDGYLLNINGSATLIYEVSGGLGIPDNLESVVNCRKRTDVEIEENKKLAEDMMAMHKKLKKQEVNCEYKEIYDVDVSYKVSNENSEKLFENIKKMEKYCYKHKVVLYTHGISSAKQVQSFYPGFVEMNGHLYCVSREKCKEILQNSALDLSFFLDYAKNGDMFQIYAGLASRKIFVAISFLFEIDTKIKYKYVFTKIYKRKQKEFDSKILERKTEIENILQKHIKTFSQWKQINSKEELRKIFGYNYEFNLPQFSFETESGRKFGQIISISDLTSKILSRGFL